MSPPPLPARASSGGFQLTLKGAASFVSSSAKKIAAQREKRREAPPPPPPPEPPPELAPPTESGEALDGFAWVLMLGTAFMFAKELTVLFFQHRKPLQPHKQARDLQAAAVVHVLNQLAFYMVLPTVFLVVAAMRGHLRALNVALLGTLLFVMNILEIYIFKVTFSVMQAKQKKARADRLNSVSRANAPDPTQQPAPTPP